MATINFLYRSTKPEANLILRLLHRHQGKDFVIAGNTKLSVSKHYWTKQHPIKKPKDMDVLNKQHEVTEELHKIEKHVLSAFNNINPEDATKNWLQTQINLYYKPAPKPESLPTGLLKYLEKYLELKGNEITPNTKKKINVIKQLLIRYEEYIGKTLNITDVDLNFKISFENYCLENLYAPSTIGIAFKFIKTICNHARNNGLEINTQMASIKVKQTKVDSIYLTTEELETIEATRFKVDNKHYETARDWLIISCYTGQRISDFMRFTKKMVRVENGKSLIEFKQVKTGKLMTVPLHSKVLQILKKRNGDFPPPIVDQKYNLYIKEVCRLAKLDELVAGSLKTETAPQSKEYRKETGMFEKYKLVTSHIGRRSFATNFYGTIPTTFLIYVTGHSTETMFLNYIGKSNKDIAMEMTNYF